MCKMNDLIRTRKPWWESTPADSSCVDLYSLICRNHSFVDNTQKICFISELVWFITMNKLRRQRREKMNAIYPAWFICRWAVPSNVCNMLYICGKPNLHFWFFFICKIDIFCHLLCFLNPDWGIIHSLLRKLKIMLIFVCKLNRNMQQQHVTQNFVFFATRWNINVSIKTKTSNR